ncbi:MAG: hypothetical protein AUG91_02490 [Actinobacteria bacterium 13_1_20CM_4_69_9]|nr:MAG: hypothetical protein AUG91_02490 [Actinobacteria bacterium 13_1_20CM_4_69_9]
MQTASGGGPLAALTTGSAAELLAGIARASLDWPDGRAVAAQAESLRDRVTPLAELSLKAYEQAVGAEGGDFAVAAAELVAVNLTVSANDERVQRANVLADDAARTAEAARAARE